jgi:phenylacetate-CoA ligase
VIDFRVGDFFYPHRIALTWWMLRRSEQWAPDRLRRFQSERLAGLMRHAGAEVPHYGALFREAGIDPGQATADNAMALLRRLPILQKEALRAQPRQFLARNWEQFKPKEITTSGTTGTPLTVYWDRDSNVLELCCIQRLWRWAKFRPGQGFLDLRSRIFERDDEVVGAGKVAYKRNGVINGLEFSSDLIDASNIAGYHELLLRFRPRLIRGHPQSIQHLATLLDRGGLGGWQPRAITTASETLYDFQREEIQRVWPVPILDSYGLKEHNVFITQCERGRHHVYAEYGICEIVDDDGNPVGPGEEGWIVATGLHNRAQVLLRYNTADRAVAAGDGEACPCGRKLPIVRKLIGRIDDCVVREDGRRYSGMHFALFGRRGIRKARLTQENYRRVVVELVVTEEFDQAERAALLDALARKVEDGLTFELQLVNDIVQDAPGKFKFVVSRVAARGRQPQPV